MQVYSEKALVRYLIQLLGPLSRPNSFCRLDVKDFAKLYAQWMLRNLPPPEHQKILFAIDSMTTWEERAQFVMQARMDMRSKPDHGAAAAAAAAPKPIAETAAGDDEIFQDDVMLDKWLEQLAAGGELSDD